MVIIHAPLWVRVGPAFLGAHGSCGRRVHVWITWRSPAGGRWEWTVKIQLAAPRLLCLQEYRCLRRCCGNGKQTFQAKGVAWAKPFFPDFSYKTEGILVICTFSCVNKELEEQKVRSRIGTRASSHSSVEVGRAVEREWSASELPPYCVSYSRISQAEGFLLCFLSFWFAALCIALRTVSVGLICWAVHDNLET